MLISLVNNGPVVRSGEGCKTVDGFPIFWFLPPPPGKEHDPSKDLGVGIRVEFFPVKKKSMWEIYDNWGQQANFCQKKKSILILQHMRVKDVILYGGIFSKYPAKMVKKGEDPKNTVTLLLLSFKARIPTALWNCLCLCIM